MLITKRKLLILSILGIVVGLFFADFCKFGKGLPGSCYDIQEGAGVPIGLYSVALFILSWVFYFSDDQIFNSWFKFAKYYLPIAFLFILSTVISPGSGSWASSGFDSELATWFTAGLFVVISIFIIVIKSWRFHRQPK
ncbi:hypothetical protein A2Z53_01505 [Candidatus Giovannonibacteria bacterium RIFCSPHIGHO2_02_42_15]|uniref:Uncharacterized protein n=2 Tax=Candidatus Giovannoniibacteriota TaxID=1752738 RepID=A0A1F5VN85_9BACT|nr:MAG: hypothetical protein UV11_C0008G0040 [Candidatus Giovannonibacteria bacterium GW2011_GWF2_42_19]OGF64862.1 MAG: hypothetical protein A2Z53_01505 [Candidatus Giovannonibacteria bacterium RIFCSPHIGHO2_02_42_15]HBW55983.1 hypothetical protein [Candidatus Azambacteria bacterium]